MMEKEAAHDLPNDTFNAVGIEPFDDFTVWQHQAGWTRFELSENLSDERAILHAPKLFSYVFIELSSSVGSERKRDQRINEIFFIEPERGIATFVNPNGEKLRQV